MRLLDLFCGAGGAAAGYARAGFEVVGVDLEPHPDYPHKFYQRDALDVLRCHGWWDIEFDAIHASPPCQAHTTMSNRWRGAGGRADEHVDLIDETRALLVETGLPYVIENVAGARKMMRDPITLTGGMFDLRVHRPRLFESNIVITQPRRRAVDNPVGVYGKAPDGRRLFDRKDGSMQRAAASLEEGASAMGIDWMTRWEDVTEAIPPAYTEYIGHQLAGVIRARRMVA